MRSNFKTRITRQKYIFIIDSNIPFFFFFFLFGNFRKILFLLIYSRTVNFFDYTLSRFSSVFLIWFHFTIYHVKNSITNFHQKYLVLCTLKSLPFHTLTIIHQYSSIFFFFFFEMYF